MSPQITCASAQVIFVLPVSGETGNTKIPFSLAVLVHCQNSTSCCLMHLIFLTHESYPRCCMTPWIL